MTIRAIIPRTAFVALAMTGAARAQPGVRAITLDDVVAAVPKAPAAAIAQHEIEAARATADAAAAWPNPSVHAETNRLTARVVAGLVLPLPLFGTVGAAHDEAIAKARVVEREATTQERELRRRAVIAWIVLARAEAEVDVRTTAAKQAMELEQLARGRLDAGAGAEVDVTTASVARARADVAVVNAKHDQQAAAAQLAGVLGWDPAAPMHAAGPLPGVAPVPLEAMRAQLAQHPERAAALARVAAADATTSRVRRGYFPTLAVEVQGSWSDPTTPGTDVLGGVVLDVPLFAHIGDQVRSADAFTAAERARLAAAEAQLSGELVAAYLHWQAAGETVTALETGVLPAQEKASRLAAQAYREGARDLATALLGDRDLATVRADLATARGELAAAWIDLQVAAGEAPGARHAP